MQKGLLKNGSMESDILTITNCPGTTAEDFHSSDILKNCPPICLLLITAADDIFPYTLNIRQYPGTEGKPHNDRVLIAVTILPGKNLFKAQAPVKFSCGQIRPSHLKIHLSYPPILHEIQHKGKKPPCQPHPSKFRVHRYVKYMPLCLDNPEDRIGAEIPAAFKIHLFNKGMRDGVFKFLLKEFFCPGLGKGKILYS